MSQKPENFEAALKQLETLVNKLEKGDLPLEEALTAVKQGVELTQYCQKTLQEAEETVTQMMTQEGEVPLDGDPA